MKDRIPPPLASPSPPDPGEEEDSGLHLVSRADLRSEARWWKLLTIFVGGLGTFGAIGVAFVAYRAVLTDAHAQQAPLELRVKIVEDQQARTNDAVYEVQKDIRELYKSTQTGRPSARLELPLPAPSPSVDGGRP